MRCSRGDLHADRGTVKWVENANVGYMPQDPQAEFDEKIDSDRLDGAAGRGKATTSRSCARRSGRLLFSRRRDEEVRQGAVGRGEGPHDLRQADARPPNVMLMDEPTNHMDMESIESLQDRAREVSRHADLRVARPRVRGGLANRIIEVQH